MAYEVVGEDDGALQARVRPSLRVRVCDIESGNGDCEDLVRRLRDGPSHGFLVGIGENRWHICLSRREKGGRQAGSNPNICLVVSL
jgi:hypothetical protein